MRQKVYLMDYSGGRKRIVEEEIEGLPSKERLIHVPALLAELFDYPRSAARMMLALGNVTLNGVKLTVDDLDVSAKRLSGGTLCCGANTALLRGSRPEAVMDSL